MSILSWETVASMKHRRTDRGKYILHVIITYAAFRLVLTSQMLE